MAKTTPTIFNTMDPILQPQHHLPPVTRRRRMESPYHNNNHNNDNSYNDTQKNSVDTQNLTSPPPLIEQLLHATYSSESRHCRIEALQCALQLFSAFSQPTQAKPRPGSSSLTTACGELVDDADKNHYTWDVRVVSRILQWRLERAAMEVRSILLQIPPDTAMTDDSTTSNARIAFDSLPLLWMELALICANLHSVWKNEDKSLRVNLFLRLPDNLSLLHLLLHLFSMAMRRHEKVVMTASDPALASLSQLTHSTERNNLVDTILRVIQLIRPWAKLKEGTVVLLSYRDTSNDQGVYERHRLQSNPNDCWIVATIIDLLRAPFGDNEDDHYALMPKLQAEAVGLIKDLTYRSTSMEKVAMYRVNGFTPMITCWCEQQLLQPSQSVTTIFQQEPHQQRQIETQMEESFAAILWNLALHLDLSQDMIHHEVIPRALSHIIANSANPRARRNATSALGNLIVACMGQRERHVHEPRPNDKVAAVGAAELFWQEEWLIQSLMICVRHDADPDTRRRAMRTLRCMVGHGVCWRRQRNDLLQFLLDVASTTQQSTRTTKNNATCRDPDDDDDDNNNNNDHHHEEDDIAKHLDTQLQACEALSYLAKDITWLQQWGPQLESGLIGIMQGCAEQTTPQSSTATGSLVRTSHPKVVLSLARALSLCIEHSPWTRSLSCYTVPLFSNLHQALCSMRVGEDLPSVHLCVAKLLQQLVAISVTSPAAAVAVPTADPSIATGNYLGTEVTRPHSACMASKSTSKVWFAKNKPLLDILTLILFGTDSGQQDQDSCEHSIQIAIEIVVLLSSQGNDDDDDDSAILALAEHEGLLTALVNVCLVTHDLNLKSKAKQAILTLVPRL